MSTRFLLSPLMAVPDKFRTLLLACLAPFCPEKDERVPAALSGHCCLVFAQMTCGSPRPASRPCRHLRAPWPFPDRGVGTQPRFFWDQLTTKGPQPHCWAPLLFSSSESPNGCPGGHRVVAASTQQLFLGQICHCPGRSNADVGFMTPCQYFVRQIKLIDLEPGKPCRQGKQTA